MRVGGAPVAANPDGSFTVAAEDLPGLTVEVADGPMASFNIGVVAAAIEAANEAIQEEATGTFVLQRITTGLVQVTASSPGGLEDTPIVLLIQVQSTVDGEQVITVSNVPDGATLSAGTNLGGGVWQLSQADLAALSVTPPLDDATDLSLLVEAAVQVGEASLTTDQPTPLPVQVTPVADPPTLTVPTDLTVPPGVPGAVAVQAEPTDTDGSETVNVVVTGLPPGATLSAGTQNADGSFTVPSTALDGLTVTVPAPDDARLTVPVTLSAVPIDTDPETGALVQGAPVTGAFTLNVVGIQLTGADVSGPEDGTIPLGLTVNADAPEGERTVTVSGVPTGAMLTAGVDQGGGVWIVPFDALPGLAITPTPQDSRNFTLSSNATVTVDGTTLGDQLDVLVDVMAVSDPVMLTIPGSTTIRPGVLTDVGVSATTVDTDGSEQVSVRLEGLPEGARLSAGTRDPDGSFTVPAAALDDLRIVLPVQVPENFTVDVTGTSRDTDFEDGLLPPDESSESMASFLVNVDMTARTSTEQVRNTQSGFASPQDPTQFVGRGRAARPTDTTPATPIRLIPIELLGPAVAGIAPGAGPEGDPATAVEEEELGRRRPDAQPLEEFELAQGLALAEVGSGQESEDAPLDEEEAILLELEQIEACPEVTLPTVAWQNTATESAFNVDPQLVPYSVDVFCAGYKLARPGRGTLADYQGMTFVLKDFWTDLDQARTPEPLPDLRDVFSP